MTPAMDAVREARAREIAWKLVIGEKVGGGDGQTYVGRTPTVREIEAALLAFADTEAASQPREGEGLTTVEDHNAAFDPADEALGGAFREGFREGWIYAQSPDGTDYDDLTEQFGRAVDIEPSEAWGAYRDKYFAMLPLAAIPEVGSPALTQRPPEQAGAVDVLDNAWTPYGKRSLHNLTDLLGIADQKPTVVSVINRAYDEIVFLRARSPAPTPPDAGPGEIPAGMVAAKSPYDRNCHFCGLGWTGAHKHGCPRAMEDYSGGPADD